MIQTITGPQHLAIPTDIHQLSSRGMVQPECMMRFTCFVFACIVGHPQHRGASVEHYREWLWRGPHLSQVAQSSEPHVLEF